MTFHITKVFYQKCFKAMFCIEFDFWLAVSFWVGRSREKTLTDKVQGARLRSK